MKKLTALLLALAMLLSFAGCVSQEDLNSAVNDATAPLKEQIAQLNADIAAKEAEIETLESEKSALTEEKTELEGEIAEIDAQIDTLNGKVAELEASGEADEAEINKLKEDISDLEGKKTELTASVAELEASISAKDAEIAGLNSSIETLTAEKQTLSDRISALEKENEALENEKTELEKENEALKNCLAGNHDYTYTDNGDGTHTLNGVCSFCDNVTDSATEAHTFLDGACTTCGVAGGYCGTEGENAAWTFKDGVFTLYGTGEVYTYGIAAKYPWYDYSRQFSSVVVKDGITNIPEDAFYNSTVKTVTIPGSVTTIEDYAFDSCNYLESITLSEGLQSIGYGAFSECYTLESITIPASVTYIDRFAFFLAGIKEFRVAEGNAVYSAMDGNLYSTDGYELTLVRYAIASENTAFVTPAGVTVIGDYAFEGTYNLKSVTISADVRRIGHGVFQGCYELTEVTILSEDIMFDDIYTFNRGDNLHTINFAGTQEQWDEMGLELPEGVIVNCNYVPEV